VTDRLTLQAAIESFPEDTTVAFTEPASWPEIPMGYMIAAGLMLAAVFFGGLSLTGRGRETKAIAAMQYNAARWTYRAAA
jgi:hypothetical protein